MSNLVDTRTYLIELNPQRWTAPVHYVSRAGGKLTSKPRPNEENEAYKASIREELERRKVVPLGGTHHEFHLILHRQIERYFKQDTLRWVSKHRVDATNVQKLTEDACQGWLYDNDVKNTFVSSQMIEQEKETRPFFWIIARSWDGPIPLWLPEGIDRAAFLRTEAEFLASPTSAPESGNGDTGNVWPPRP